MGQDYFFYSLDLFKQGHGLPSIRASLSLPPHSSCAQITLYFVNIDPDVVHKNSLFLVAYSLRPVELFSCYLTPITTNPYNNPDLAGGENH